MWEGVEQRQVGVAGAEAGAWVWEGGAGARGTSGGRGTCEGESLPGALRLLWLPQIYSPVEKPPK